jgi:hypothetical protein
MRAKSRSAGLLILSGMLVLILLWAWIRDDAPAPAGSEEGTETTPVASTELPTEEDVTATVEGLESPRTPAAQASATNPEAAPAAPADTEALSQPLSAEQLIVLQDLESELAAALDGNQDEAVALAGFLNQCQVTFRDRSRVEQSIARAGRSFAAGKPLTQFRPSGPPQQFETLQAFESSQWDTFFRCEAARSLINNDFWGNLEQLADAGHPVARYLFATLMRNAPSQIASFDLWDEELQHREQAREYTWRNLEEREPRGLLALVQSPGQGMSMRGSGAGFSTNSVLVLAAVKCGLTTPDLLQSVDQLLQQVERMETTQPGALEQLNAASDEARRMFCK